MVESGVYRRIRSRVVVQRTGSTQSGDILGAESIGRKGRARLDLHRRERRSIRSEAGLDRTRLNRGRPGIHAAVSVPEGHRCRVGRGAIIVQRNRIAAHGDDEISPRDAASSAHDGHAREDTCRVGDDHGGRGGGGAGRSRGGDHAAQDQRAGALLGEAEVALHKAVGREGSACISHLPTLSGTQENGRRHPDRSRGPGLDIDAIRGNAWRQRKRAIDTGGRACGGLQGD